MYTYMYTHNMCIYIYIYMYIGGMRALEVAAASAGG